MDKNHLIRQMEAIPLEVLETPLTFIGAGAIGSHAAMACAKMGMSKIHVIDPDIVSEENMNAQGFPLDAIGKPKVVALRDEIKRHTGTEITFAESIYTEGRFPGIVVMSVDNMATRIRIYEEHKATAHQTKAFIDPRMAIETALMYVMNPMDPKDQKAYEKTLYSDEDAVPERCTNKSTIYTASMLAGHVVKAIKDLITGNPYLRVLIWDIKNNEYEGYPSEVPKALQAVLPPVTPATATL